jgi:phosphocarrier protein HPr
VSEGGAHHGDGDDSAGELRRTLRIRNKLGLHARAAVKFVQLAGQFQSEIKVCKDGQEANGKSIMGLLTLVAAFGMEIDMAVSGPDADKAMAALAALVERGFDEGVFNQGPGDA